MLHFPRLLSLATILVHWVELLAPPLYFVPVRRQKMKTAACLILMGLHICLVSCMRIDLLFWSPFVALIVLLPTAFWDWAAARYYEAGRDKRNLVLHVDTKNWLSSRVLFVFYTFFLGESGVSVHFLHLNEGTANHNQHDDTWLVVENGGKTVKGVAAFRVVLCFLVFSPFHL